jgi:hypothetical protein
MTRKEVERWCKKFKIKSYYITSDLMVSTDERVDISGMALFKIPIKFYKVGSFNCSNNNLTDLENGPDIVEYYYICYNNKLTNLDYGPIECEEFYSDPLPGLKMDGRLVSNYYEYKLKQERSKKIKNILNN